MGIFDSYINDIKTELLKGAKNIETVKNTAQSGSQQVVAAIDKLESVVNNLPSQHDVTEKIKRELKADDTLSK